MITTKDMMRLPEKWSLYLVEEPETGMGYQIATVILKDGRRFPKTSTIDCTYVGSIDGDSKIPFSRSDIESIIVDHGKSWTIMFHLKRRWRRAMIDLKGSFARRRSGQTK